MVERLSGTWAKRVLRESDDTAGPGGTTTGWSIPVPGANRGEVYSVQAVAHGTNGLGGHLGPLAPTEPSKSSFSVAHLKGAPMLATTQGVYVAPGNSIMVGGSGFGANEAVTITLSGTKVSTIDAGQAAASHRRRPDTGDSGFRAGVVGGNRSEYQAHLLHPDRRLEPVDIFEGNGSLHQSAEPNDTVLWKHVAESQRRT